MTKRFEQLNFKHTKFLIDFLILLSMLTKLNFNNLKFFSREIIWCNLKKLIFRI